jgi:Fis family transcriptional regulator
MQQDTTHSNPVYSPKAANRAIYQQHPKKNLPLHAHVEHALNTYLIESEGQCVTELYNTLLAAIEPPLLKVILRFCKTQHAAARMLGISRGTLRKKLKHYHFTED